jgi:N-acyl-L-homoserine lactone synthetase
MSFMSTLPADIDLFTIYSAVGKMIDATGSIRFEVAQTPAEREAIYRLRYQTVIEQGWAQPEDYPDGLELDGYDDKAVHIAGWDIERLVGSARIVFPIPGQPLPTEADHSLEIDPLGQVADVSRTIVVPAYSEGQHRISGALMGRCTLEVLARGYYLISGSATLSMTRLYRRLGYVFTILGEPKHIWGEERYPIRFDPVASAVGILHRMNQNGKVRETAEHIVQSTFSHHPLSTLLRSRN